MSNCNTPGSPLHEHRSTLDLPQTLSSSTTWTQFSPRNFSQDVSVGEVVDELDRGAQWLASFLVERVLEGQLSRRTVRHWLLLLTRSGASTLSKMACESCEAFMNVQGFSCWVISQPTSLVSVEMAKLSLL